VIPAALQAWPVLPGGPIREQKREVAKALATCNIPNAKKSVCRRPVIAGNFFGGHQRNVKLRALVWQKSRLGITVAKMVWKCGFVCLYRPLRAF
jgi:hypothetical protein